MNNTVKGRDNYPRTMATTLRFLQYHDLRGKQQMFQKKETKIKEKDLTFENIVDDAKERDKLEWESEPNKVTKKL